MMKHAMRLFTCLAAGMFGFVAQAALPDPTQAARSYYAEGDYLSAARSFEEVMRIFPGDVTAMNNLAVAKAANGEYRAALDLLSRAHQLAPHRRDIEANLRELQGHLQYYDKSRPALPTDATLPEPPEPWADASAQARRPGATTCTRKPCK